MAKKRKRCRRVKSGPRKGLCRLKRGHKSGARKGKARSKRSKRLSAAVCRKSYQLVSYNPVTGKKYKRARCATATKRGKVRTHTPRKVAGVKVAKIIAVG